MASMIAVEKGSPVYCLFMSMLSDALYWLLPGEEALLASFAAATAALLLHNAAAGVRSATARCGELRKRHTQPELVAVGDMP